MNQKLFRGFAYLLVFICGGFSATAYASWFSSDNSIHVVENSKPKAPTTMYKASIQVADYVDARTNMGPKKIGNTTEIVSGHYGKDLELNRKVTELVATAIKNRFIDAGFQLPADGSALYEISGTIQKLSYNVGSRDEVSIAIETTLKEVATGNIIWSGLVKEADERFAGISGNSKKNIARYLKFKLGVVTKKTYAAISATLMSSRPDLFNLRQGTKVIAGVTQLHVAKATTPAPVANDNTATLNGTLILSTTPTRAKVYLDGIYFGLSPLHAEVGVGIHEISVKAKGYKTGMEKVSIRKGDTTELEMTLER
ncbi:MAG: PEGA domain-containing protein [Gallionellaceae bacterium]